MARRKVAPENRIRAAQACEECKRRKQKVRTSPRKSLSRIHCMINDDPVKVDTNLWLVGPLETVQWDTSMRELR